MRKKTVEQALGILMDALVLTTTKPDAYLPKWAQVKHET